LFFTVVRVEFAVEAPCFPAALAVETVVPFAAFTWFLVAVVAAPEALVTDEVFAEVRNAALVVD
jgi:hypothetical protein